MRLLVTRPEPDGERTAAALRARGHDVLLAPLLRMQSVNFELADEPYAAVVMTSANAGRALTGHPALARLIALPAFTVGRHTADAARAAGFRDVHSADGDQRDVAALIRSRLPLPNPPPHSASEDARERANAGEGREGVSLLYLAAEDRAGDLAGALTGAGFRVRMVVSYRAVKAERFPSEVEAAFGAQTINGVLHFSRRTVEAYLDCAGRAGLLAAALQPAQFCLSRQVAEPLQAAGATAIRFAPRPDEASLLGLVDAEAGSG
jgi:uroporphyrinogen-III synthase